jgi:hypothetical protein
LQFQALPYATIQNSTTTNAFTTNASSTNATSTNFFAINGTINKATLVNASSTNLTIQTDTYLSALTAGSVPFIGTNGLVSQNNTQLFWDNTATRLSVGTTSPSGKLSVQGTLGSTAPLFTVASTTNASFATSSLFTVLANGNVGIGTAVPTSMLSVNGGNIQVLGSVAPSVLITPSSGSAYVVGANTAITGMGIYDSTAGAWRLTVKDTTGNVGIGTTSPSTILSLGSTATTIKAAIYDAGGSALYGIGAANSNLTFGAAKDLEKKHIKAIVVNIHTIKPLDEDLIIKVAKETKAIVTVEEHQKIGGLGSAVSECLAKNFPVPVEFVGIDDTFGQSGTPKELIEHYGIGRDGITSAVLKVIDRK